MIDWENLPLHNPLKDEAFKSVATIFPLNLTGTISTKRLSITDEGLKLVSYEDEKEIVNALHQYLKGSWNLPLEPQFILNSFTASRRERWGFELNERVDVLRLAIRILTTGKCFQKASFKYNDSINPPVLYLPFVDRNSIRESLDAKETAIISSEADFEILKLIYNQLSKLDVFKYDERFSKLLNAVRFYNRFDDVTWFLQKIVHAFVGLESLFTDQSKSEITYKVSIRSAYFLYPENSVARNEVFDLLRIAYDVRSSFLHGSRVDEIKLTKKLQELKKNDQYSLWYDLPSDLNNILSHVLRTTLLKEDLFSFFAGDPDKKTEIDFYNQLVLGTK